VTAQADPPHVIGAYDLSTVGLPTAVHPGQTVYAHTWFIDKSKDTLFSNGFDMLIEPLVGEAVPSVQVYWLNPRTHLARFEPYRRIRFLRLGSSASSEGGM
jgi:hypothetical protein